MSRLNFYTCNKRSTHSRSLSDFTEPLAKVFPRTRMKKRPELRSATRWRTWYGSELTVQSKSRRLIVRRVELIYDYEFRLPI